MNKFCEQCGSEISSDTASFCGECGAPGVESAPAISEPAPAEPTPLRHVSQPATGGSTGADAAYRLSKWRGWLTILFSLQTLMAIFAASTFIWRRDVALSPGSSWGDFVKADEDVELAFNSYMMVAVATFVILIMWSWRVAKNTHLWATPRHSTGWAIGGWFCPIANFFVPYRILHDGWRLTPNSGSKSYDPVGGPTERVTNEKLTPLLIGWIAWWAGQLVSRVGAAGNPESLKSLADQDAWVGAGFFVVAAASVFLLIAIRRISARHDEYSSAA